MSMDWEKAKALVDGAKHIVILTHISPDGDAIGSMLGLGHALRAHGKKITYAVDEGTPFPLSFLPGARQVLPTLNGTSGKVRADLVIVTDCGDERRIGEVGKVARTFGVPFINLDHHPTNTLFGDVNLVDTATVASAEGVMDWLDNMGLPLTPEAAQCLMCGLVTDTLCFRTDSVKASTLGKAQRLMDEGADLSEVVQRTVNRIPAVTIRLWAQVMSTVRLEDHVIWAKVTRAARQAANAENAQSGGLVSLLLQADEAYVSCVITEEEDEVDISLRAVPGFDVSQIAVNLGGGGHVLAAGASLKGATLDEVETQIIPMLKAAAQSGTPTFA